MIIFWRGWGILSILIVAVTSMVVTSAIAAIMTLVGVPKGMATQIGMPLGFLAASAANWFLGKKLNSEPARELVDTKTGQRVMLRSRHQLFFINMEYWSIPVALLALLSLVALFAHGSIAH